MEQGGAMDLVDSYESQVPGLAKGKYAGQLEDLVHQDLYSGGGGMGAQQQSSLYAPPPPDPATVEATPSTATELPQDVSSGIYTDALQLAAGDEAKGVPPKSLHEARMLLIGNLRGQGYSEDVLASAYDIIGTAFNAAGGQIDAPMTDMSRDQNAMDTMMQQQQQQQQLESLMPGGASGSFNTPIEGASSSPYGPSPSYLPSNYRDPYSQH